MKKDISFLKIIYFDEESATDLIYMKNKGRIVESIIDNEKTNLTGETKMGGEVATKNSLLSLLGVKFGLSAGASVAHGSEQLINQAITNTVLTDYLLLSETEEKIKKFTKSSVKPYKNSLSYFKIITPYMSMTEGKMDAGEIKVNIPLMDEAIKNGKGYYELILTNSNDQVYVLRFNLKSFKNSYSLTDLVKMQLTYHAVKVGEIYLNDLDVEREFLFENNPFVDGSKLANGEDDEKEEKVEVFDVMLAGVQND